MTQDHHNLDPKIRALAAWQAEASTETLQILAQDPNVVVRQNVLRVAQQREDLELLEVFLLDPDPVLRAELALWSDCPASLLRRFKQDPNPALRGIFEHRTEQRVEPAAPEEHHEYESTTAPPEPEEMPELDEPTGAVLGSDKLPPALKEEAPTPPPREEVPRPLASGSAPKPVPIPTRTPVTGPLRSTPIPVRPPLAASPNPLPMPLRPSPLPLKSPLIASAPHAPAPIPTPAPAPFAPPIREEISRAPLDWPAPAPAPLAAPSLPTLAEDEPEDEPVEVAAPKVASPLPGKGEIRIHLTASDKSQSELTFAKDLLVIGRVMGNDIVLAQGNVSKNHCRIFVFNDQLYVEDLKSTNGTQLNKNNITPREPHLLSPTDELGVGSATLKLSLFL